ncbi:MAG TPA: hypothetical protein VK570_06845 [Rubrivivax sp.]|jgi:hypothetical protein|nr:hypothetical protein [Rubrivivax sp.]
MRRALLATLLLLAPATAALAETLVAGANGQPLTLTDALARARDGDTIELLPGEYRGNLVLNQRKLTLRGVGKVTIQGDGKLAGNGDAKALWTVRGGDVTIENVIFRGARAADGGGAGVRQEGGRLTLRRCQLFDNEYGLLAINDQRAEVVIENSVFGMAPKVVGGLHHLLSVGRINKVSVTGSRFQQGFEGHLIKTRARESYIGYNMIHDGIRGGASYEINVAEGGVATIIGNVIGQGADSQNPTVVAFGTEGRGWEKNTLLLAHNTLIHNGWMPAWFLRSFADRLPQGAELHAINNLLVGPGVFWLGAAGNFAGNRQASGRMLRDIETYGFELPPGSMWRGSGVDPRQIAGQDLSPKREFEWPVGTRELPVGLTSWSPGAYQR